MKIDILTLFPEMFSALDESILKKAKEKGILDIDLVNIRDFSLDPNKRCDDYCYGGGSGMLMTPQPLYDSIKSVLKDDTTLIYMSPKGKKLNDNLAFELSQKPHIAIICGHYEGIDERILDIFKPMEICFIKISRYKLSVTFFNSFYCRLCQLIHLYKPLL